jgi:hydroxyethylthiazole kinase
MDDGNLGGRCLEQGGGVTMLEILRAKRPIVHCITNHVVSNFQANGLLALGASPIMGEAYEEVEELAMLADALSLNIGTLNKISLNSMLMAGKTANSKGTPVVLDPVGAGATAFRLSAIRQLIEEVNITVLRCNAGELAAIAGVEWQAKGVDAGQGNVDVIELAMQMARKYKFIVAITGEVDVVTDGEEMEEIPYGTPLMSSVTGMGCLLSSVVAAFLATSPDHPMAATSEALRFYAICGEKVAPHSQGTGSFHIAFLDELASMPQRNYDNRNRLGEAATWKLSNKF